MKKLSKIKLTNLSQEDLADREMNALRGGNNCGCGCNNGGPSSKHNVADYNWNGNLYSPGGNDYCSWEGSGVVTVYGGSKAPGMP